MIVQAQFFRHQTKQEIDIAALPQQEREFAFLKGRQQAPRELFSVYRRNADRGVFRHAAAEDRKDGGAGFAGQCRGGSRIDAEIEGGGDVRDTCKVDGLMVMRARDIQQELLGNGVRDGLIVGDDGACQRRRRETAGQVQNGAEADQTTH